LMNSSFDNGGQLTMIPGEEASMLHLNDGVLHGVTTIDQFVSLNKFLFIVIACVS